MVIIVVELDLLDINSKRASAVRHISNVEYVHLRMDDQGITRWLQFAIYGFWWYEVTSATLQGQRRIDQLLHHVRLGDHHSGQQHHHAECCHHDSSSFLTLSLVEWLNQQPVQ